MDLKRFLLSVAQSPNFQSTGTNLGVFCFLLPFLHTKITFTQSAWRIQLSVVDYPSAILLVLLPASFLLRPVFFWKVSVIITALSLLFNCISGLLRRPDQGNQGFPVPSPQEADDDVRDDVEPGISLSATQIQEVEARTPSGMLPVILFPWYVSVIITALSQLLNRIFGLLRRPNQGNQGVSVISQVPEIAVDCEAGGPDQNNQGQIGRSGASTPLADIPLVDADGDQIPAEAVNEMSDLADGLAQPEAIDVELREFP